MSTINERIAQCIATTGLTKTAFAKRINLSQPHISKIALGDSTPSDRTIADICREFNINETWLRTGDGEMFVEIPETLADKLAKEYKLDDLGRQIMAAYLRLDESDRQAVGRMLQNLMDARATGQKQMSAPAFVAAPVDTRTEKPVKEWTDAELHAELDWQFAEQRETAENSPAFWRGRSETA